MIRVLTGICLIVALGLTPSVDGWTDFRTIIWRGNHGWARADQMAPLATIRQIMCSRDAPDGWVHFWPGYYNPQSGASGCNSADDPGDPP